MTSDEAQASELITTLRNQRLAKQALQPEREALAAMEAKSMRGHKTIPGLGKALCTVPAHEYFLLEKMYPGCWQDREFIKGYQKHLSDMKIYSA